VKVSLPGLSSLLALGLIIAWVVIVLRTWWGLVRPPRRTYGSAVSAGRPGTPDELPPGPNGQRTFESWTFRARSVDLPVWDIEGEAPDGPTWVLCHGWGDSRIGGLTRVPAVIALASRVIVWDMPGHGDAPGNSSLGAHEPDALLALLERLGPSVRVVLFGWSMGAGVAIATAARIAAEASSPAGGPRARCAGIVGIVAEAPYRFAPTPAQGMLRTLGLPVRGILAPALALAGLRSGVGISWRGFDRAALARGVGCPLLVIHGESDAICPLQDGRDIAAAARGELVTLANTGHYGVWTQEPAAGVAREAVAAWSRRLSRTIADARQSDS